MYRTLGNAGNLHFVRLRETPVCKRPEHVIRHRGWIPMNRAETECFATVLAIKRPLGRPYLPFFLEPSEQM
jgi:hypothetical protein